MAGPEGENSAGARERVAAGGPLSGLRVVELAGLGPGPFAAMLLADMGADVVRVERPGGSGGDRDPLNRGKRTLVADLKHEQGAQAILGLVERADVLLEGFRPGVAERLGVGPRDCWARNPQLIYGRMTGWGQDGPLASAAGHDVDYIALSGVLHSIGRAGGPPQIPVNLLGDFGGGAMYLTVGVLAALLRARGDGSGQVVDASVVDGSAHLATMLFGMLASGGWSTERGSNLLDGGAPFYDVYATADGEYMAVGALEPQFYEQLLTGLGLSGRVPDRDDPADWPALRERFTEAFASRTRQEWTEVFEGTDACVAPVLSMTEAAEHPHLRDRGTLVDSDGGLQPAPAPRFSHTPSPSPRPVVGTPGAHSAEVLRDWQVPEGDRLIESGAVHIGESAKD